MVVDGVTKIVVHRMFPPGQGMSFAGIMIQVHREPGIFFSRIPSPAVALVLSVAALVLVMLLLKRERVDETGILSGLLVGGGLSNVGERLVYGSVTDIFLFPGGLTTNIADIAILIGVGWILSRA